MTILISMKDRIITLDNHSMMAEPNMIVLSEVGKNIAIDEDITKEQAKELLEKYIEEFLKC